MKTALDPTIRGALSRAADYREFVRVYFELMKVSYAAFARKAGFESRSFPRDVSTGKRRLSPASLVKFQKALGLSTSGQKFFELLVARDEPTVREALKYRVEVVQDALARARLRFSQDVSAGAGRRDFRKKPLHEVDVWLSIPWIAPLMAALGDADSGASLTTMAHRLSLSPAKIEPSLKQMVQNGLCREAEGVFYPLQLHEKIQGAGKSRFFLKIFEEATLMACRRASQALESDEEFFFVSSFLVAQKRLPELKLRLRNLLMEFVDENIDSEGQVVQLSSSLHKFVP